MAKNNLNLDVLQAELEKIRPKKRKKKIKGTGFAKQKQVMEQSGYYDKSKKKRSIKIIKK